MEEYKVKRKIIKAVKILVAYIMLNIGLLSWIEVSSVSGNKISSAQTAMAEIKKDPDKGMEISILGRSAVFYFSFMESKDVQTLLFAFADPIFIPLVSDISGFDFE